MPRLFFTRTRLLVALATAAVLAILAAGPGSRVVPDTARLTERLVCADGSQLHPNSSSLADYCQDAAGQVDTTAGARVFATLAGLYFVIFLPLLLAYTVTVRPARSATPPRQTGRQPSLEVEVEVRQRLAANERGAALKAARAGTGMSRGEAQRYVEMLEKNETLPPSYRATTQPR